MLVEVFQSNKGNGLSVSICSFLFLRLYVSVYLLLEIGMHSCGIQDMLISCGWQVKGELIEEFQFESKL